MVWALVAMAAVSAVGSISSANSARAQNENQAAWNRYNAQMGYNADMSNLQSQAMLGMFNASMAMNTANSNATAGLQIASFNANQVRQTVAYNDELLAEEERLMWEAAELDEELLHAQRQKERGNIIAGQAASGTTIGEGSNKDVVVAQEAQEAMDAFVLRHNADIRAAKITNARAQGAWQGEMQVQKIMYEGQMGSYMTQTNGQAQAMSTLASTMLGVDAGATTAQFKLASGMSGASVTHDAHSAQITSNLTNGLFSAASSAYSAYNSQSVVPAQHGASGSNISLNAGYGSWQDDSLLYSGGR